MKKICPMIEKLSEAQRSVKCSGKVKAEVYLKYKAERSAASTARRLERFTRGKRSVNRKAHRIDVKSIFRLYRVLIIKM